jgi:hypothetical protein
MGKVKILTDGSDCSGIPLVVLRHENNFNKVSRSRHYCLLSIFYGLQGMMADDNSRIFMIAHRAFNVSNIVALYDLSCNANSTHKRLLNIVYLL